MVWTAEPPEESGQQPLPVVRVKAKRPLECVIECRTWCGVLTHFWNKQTILHTEHDCPACDANWRPTWQGFLVVGNSDGTKRVLLQITPLAANCLKVYKRTPKQLLGCRVRFQRLGRRDNSPLDAKCIGWAAVDIETGPDRVEHAVARLLRINIVTVESKSI